MFAHRPDILDVLNAIPVITGGHKDKQMKTILKIEGFVRLMIGPEFYDTHKDRIILAIAINEIECWVLPFHATKKVTW